MKYQTLSFYGCLLLGLLGFGLPLSPVSATESAEASKQIDALISHVEGLEDVKFIRNGKEYSARNAAKFLRGKRKAKADEITTALDFIEKVASYSGTTGKPYRIRLQNGSERPHGEYLKQVLSGLRTK